jgi:hypothetical protein
VVFEPTIPVFEREKMVHALDRAAIVIGRTELWIFKNYERWFHSLIKKEECD